MCLSCQHHITVGQLKHGFFLGDNTFPANVKTGRCSEKDGELQP